MSDEELSVMQNESLRHRQHESEQAASPNNADIFVQEINASINVDIKNILETFIDLYGAGNGSDFCISKDVDSDELLWLLVKRNLYIGFTYLRASSSSFRGFLKISSSASRCRSSNSRARRESQPFVSAEIRD